MTRCTSSCGAAAALLLLSTTTSGFVAVTNNHHNNPLRTPTSRTAALHATTENFQRSLLAAQIANNNNERNSSPTKSIATATQSVDYDAAARLAYKASGGSTDDDDFAAFKSKYLQDTSNLVATKQRTRVAKEKAAAAKLKAQKAAEAAQLAKEKAQAKIREREDAVVAAAAAKTAAADVSKESEKESSPQPVDDTDDAVTVIRPTPPAPVVSAATTQTPAEESEASTTTTTTESSSSSGTIPRELALVPINESTVQFTAGALGLTAGLVLGGPLLAIFLSATANYLSRKDDEPQPGKEESATSTSPKRIVDTASQTALLIYNFLAQFERDNKIVDGTFKLIEGAVDKAKQSEEGGETIASLENTLGGVAKSVEKLNEDFDLVGGAGTVLNSVGDLVEDSVDKVIDLNDQFKLTERVGSVVKGAVAKVTEKKD
ncbi:hypothetical protein QTG54_006724 [Skeletonema marinoi]|uniref:Uncharacterized protein n=1 Tax=Skeletonema marinoi TaxID=267567 RepID=A0AAD8YAR2_9STRA|nr:hypothetical protein QTG54_006724 [Skeletonema marinoi]